MNVRQENINRLFTALTLRPSLERLNKHLQPGWWYLKSGAYQGHGFACIQTPPSRSNKRLIKQANVSVDLLPEGSCACTHKNRMYKSAFFSCSFKKTRIVAPEPSNSYLSWPVNRFIEPRFPSAASNNCSRSVFSSALVEPNGSLKTSESKILGQNTHLCKLDIQ